MWERVIWGGGRLTSSPQTSCPAVLQPCFHVLPLNHQAALVQLKIGRSHRVKASKRSERHSTHLFPSFLLPSLHQCQPKPFRVSLKGEVTNFIYTLIRSSDKSLSLWVEGVNDLLWSSQQLLLKFSCLIVTRLEEIDLGYSVWPCKSFLANIYSCQSHVQHMFVFVFF